MIFTQIVTCQQHVGHFVKYCGSYEGGLDIDLFPELLILEKGAIGSGRLL